MSGAQLRHVLDLSGETGASLRSILDEAHRLKAAKCRRSNALEGRTLAMLFERPSTRTRFSFDIAMHELGGHAITSSGAEMQLGRGESLADTARVLSRYVDAVMIRMLDHDGLCEFANHASVPVINGLTRRSHPCQIVADLMTVEEWVGPIEGRSLAWVGDGNNVAATFLEAAPHLRFNLRLSSPPELALDDDAIVEACAEGADVVVTPDPRSAVSGADAVIADSWVSMGDEDEARRRKLLTPYRVDEALMAHAGPSAIFLHCLPAHRGDEVTDAVMDGPRSAVFDEAENRVHAQKAILKWVFGLI